MKAMVMTGTGGPEVLQMREMDPPAIRKPNEVLVRLKAAGVNPIDTKLRRRDAFGGVTEGVILGCDGAGVIEETGSEVRRFKSGDTVYFCYGGIGPVPGTYAEFTVVPEIVLARKPRSLEFVDAAASPLVLITAWEALFDRARIHAGARVFIHGGAGGVGHVAIQLAKNAGCTVATTISSQEKAEFVRRLGADCCIDYKKEDVTRALLAWTHGAGVDAALDTVGGEAFKALIAAVRVGGDLVTLLQVPDDTDWKALRQRNIRLSQELMLTPMQLNLEEGLDHQRSILEKCAELFDTGKLQIHVSRLFPLSEAAEAHRLLESGGMTGKIVLTIHESPG